MKNLKETLLRAVILTVVATLGLSNVIAGGGIQVKTVKNNSIMVVSIMELEQQSVKLSIEDSQEQTIYYSENMSDKQSVQKAFDVSALSDGDYVIIAKTGAATLKERITVKDSEVIIKERVEVKKPVFKMNNNKLIVYFDNQTEELCSINFTKAEEVFFSDHSYNADVAKKYNLSELPVGEYTVSVNGGGESFQYAVTIQ